MKKFFIDILCAFVPNPERRRNLRQRLRSYKHITTQTVLTTCQNEFNRIQDSIAQMKFAHDNATQTIASQLSSPSWINRHIEKKLSTALMHQKTFLPFKAIHSGQDIVIVATGPSLNDFQPIDNAIYIGVNTSFLSPNVTLDYLFAQDYTAVASHIDQMNHYRPGKCKKFYGLTTEYESGFQRVIPESHAIAAGAFRYRTDWEHIPGFCPEFAYDISAQSLGCFGSIVFPAIQFALWTNPRRIYLVGCDCSRNGHFFQTSATSADSLIPAWQRLKEFVSIYYPETEIISVNPVGLRGLFTDLDQK